MKNINELMTPDLIGKVGQHQPEQRPALSEEDVQFINHLFETLKALFPAWKTSLPTSELEAATRRQWTISLIENNCTSPAKLKRGLSQARKWANPFLPSVGQFISWCQLNGQDLGLPSDDEAFKQSVMTSGQRHPAVTYALRLMPDPYNYREKSSDRARQTWNPYWQKTLEFAEAGGKFPEPEKQIEQKQTEASREQALKRLDELKAMLNG